MDDLALTPVQQGAVAGVIVFAVLTTITLMVEYSWHKWGRPQRTGKMNPARERFINAVLADVVTDGMECMIEQEVLTREEVDKIIYVRLGNLLKAYDLLPRNKPTISQAIRTRLTREWMRVKARAQEVKHKPREFPSKKSTV